MPAWAIVGSAVVGGYMANEAADAQADAAGAATAEDRRQFDLTWNANAPYREGGVNALGNLSLLTGEADPRIATLEQAKRDIASKFRQRINANTAGEVFSEAARMFGVDNWNQVTDDQIINALSTNEGAQLEHWARGHSDLIQELKGINAQQASLGTAPQQSVENMVKLDPSYQFRLKEGEDSVNNMLSAQNLRLGGTALKGISDYNQDFASTEYQNIFNRNATIAGYGPSANQTPSNNIPQNIMQQGNAAANQATAWNPAIQGGIQNYITYDQQQQWMNALSPPRYTTDYSIPMTSTSY